MIIKILAYIPLSLMLLWLGWMVAVEEINEWREKHMPRQTEFEIGEVVRLRVVPYCYGRVWKKEALNGVVVLTLQCLTPEHTVLVDQRDVRAMDPHFSRIFLKRLVAENYYTPSAMEVSYQK